MGINYQRIGERMRILREVRNMSVSELAAKTNFTAKSLLLAENGKANLSLEFLIDICDALSVTPNDILQGEFIATDLTKLEQETLIDEFIEKINAIREEEGDSRTVIKDTNRTIDEIRRMLNDYRRGDGLRKEPPEEQKKKYKGSYYR